MDVFAAAAGGRGMQLPVIRLREVLKFCSQAVRITKIAMGINNEAKLRDLWRIEELTQILADLGQSSKVTNAASLKTPTRQLVGLINQGIGNARSKPNPDETTAGPGKAESDEPLNKLAKRQMKKTVRREEEQQRVAAKESDNAERHLKQKKKRKVRGIDGEKADP